MCEFESNIGGHTRRSVCDPTQLVHCILCVHYSIYSLLSGITFVRCQIFELVTQSDTKRHRLQKNTQRDTSTDAQSPQTIRITHSASDLTCVFCLLLLLDLLFHALEFLLQIGLECGHQISKTIGRHLVQAALFGNYLGPIERGNAKLSGPAYHKALRQSLHKLLIVAQVAQQNSEHHVEDRRV